MTSLPSQPFPLGSEQSQCLALCPAPLSKASAEGSVITLSPPILPYPTPFPVDLLCPSMTMSALLNLGGTSLHWFPLADKAVKPTSSPPSTSSPVHPIRKWRPSQPRSSSLSFSMPSQETVLYHLGTHECLLLELNVQKDDNDNMWRNKGESLNPGSQGLNQTKGIHNLDQPRDEYSPFSSGPPLTTYQFLVTWASPIPRECPSYFLFDEDLGGWYMDRRWMVAAQLALEKLQAVIMDTLALVQYPQMAQDS
ncbi:hypothetical protein BS47DRAFT_1365024 [Hydnum rufescens UP504]|uniref:Uncharacterized protein n=1 Tax=Hydnum rufescens UP504 TaxID=1448309 RepID=A0A9P6APU4_9AGAM|nr:hypothetical protein BS47DRAFT_1365024 [Hydnum rufescens UP504]